MSNLNVIYLMVTVEMSCYYYNDNVDYCNDRLQSFTWRSWVQISIFFWAFFATALVASQLQISLLSSQSLTVTLSKKTFSPLITQFVFRCFVWFLCCLGVLLLLLCLGVSCGYVAVVVFRCFVWFCSCCCV